MEYQNLNNIDNRFFHYSIIIYTLSVVSSFLCGYYVNDHICNIKLDNETIF